MGDIILKGILLYKNQIMKSLYQTLASVFPYVQ